MVGIAIVMLMIGIAVPIFSPKSNVIKDVERPEGETVSFHMIIFMSYNIIATLFDFKCQGPSVVM